MADAMVLDTEQHRLGTDVVLPYVSLQPDYAQARIDVAQGLHGIDKAWLSAYALNAPRGSIHTKVLLSPGDAGARQRGAVSVVLDSATAGALQVQVAENSDTDLVVSTRNASQQAGPSKANRPQGAISLPPATLRIPRRTIGPLVKGALGLTAFDTSPTSNGLYVAGGADGQAHIARLSEPDEASLEHRTDIHLDRSSYGDDTDRLAQERLQRREREKLAAAKTYLKGHVGDIRSTNFFPSGEVILTTSSDLTARIFGIDGCNPRTFTGHRRGILTSAFVDRGKQVLTGSSDGTIRIWDVAEGSQLGSLMSHRFSAVNAISLGRDSGDTSASQGNLLVTGLSNGLIEAHDLSSRQVVFRVPTTLFPSGSGPAASDSWEQVTTGGIETLDWSRDSNLLTAGSSNGIVLVHDMRMLSTFTAEAPSTIPATAQDVDAYRGLVASWRRNGAAINDIALLPGSSHRQALIATADGTPYRVDLCGPHGGAEGQAGTASTFVPRVVEEYNGWDVDNVQACGVDYRGRTWLAGAEGKVRMYY